MMSNIIEFRSKANINTEGKSRQEFEGKAKCLHCKHEWVATQKEGDVVFCCPECGLNKAVWNNTIQRGEYIFNCVCGCDLFGVSKINNTPFIYCIMCGNCVDPYS